MELVLGWYRTADVATKNKARSIEEINDPHERLKVPNVGGGGPKPLQVSYGKEQH